ncbi:MAG: hypothetical protein DCC71_07770 [Proteobacteria bacterium]|nr:MAG: hypothetical protein DCC71_07770 [Pseudomonadota bacterium]
MWILTPIGFFSIVEKSWDRDPGTLTVRARVREDLDALRERFLPELGAVAEDERADYRYRAQAPRKAVADAMRRLVGSIDYDNFKDEVAKRQGSKRAQLYHAVWDVLYRLQSRPRR